MANNEISVGERNRVWFYPGPDDDQDGPYEARFRSTQGVYSAWTALTAGVDQKGVPGFYCWGATADVPDSVSTDVIVAPGRYTSQIRFTSGRLVDLDDVGPLYVRGT